MSQSNTRSLQGVAIFLAVTAAAALVLYQGGYFPAIKVPYYNIQTTNNPSSNSSRLMLFHYSALLLDAHYMPLQFAICHAGVCSQLPCWQIWLLGSLCLDFCIRNWRQNLFHSSAFSYASGQMAQLHRLGCSTQLDDLHICCHWCGLQKRPRPTEQYASHWAVPRRCFACVLWVQNTQGIQSTISACSCAYFNCSGEVTLYFMICLSYVAVIATKVQVTQSIPCTACNSVHCAAFLRCAIVLPLCKRCRV